MTSPERVWNAVDRLTKPTQVPLHRVADPEWLNELARPAWGVCSVAAYRSATARNATIPALWDSAVAAIAVSSEPDSGGTAPLRERSPVDVELLEILAIIRETTQHELEKHCGHDDDGVRRAGCDTCAVLTEPVPVQIRRLASLTLEQRDADLEWWEYRFAQWARLLENKLQAAEHTAKPTRLRTPCPLCKTRQVRVDVDGEVQLAPPIVVDFRDGYVRAAHCEACGQSWFRGAELHELATLVSTDPNERITA